MLLNYCCLLPDFTLFLRGLLFVTDLVGLLVTLFLALFVVMLNRFVGLRDLLLSFFLPVLGLMVAEKTSFVASSALMDRPAWLISANDLSLMLILMLEARLFYPPFEDDFFFCELFSD